MKMLIVMLSLVSIQAFAQGGADASIYNNLGNPSNQIKPYQMPIKRSANIQTTHMGNSAYTTGTDSNGKQVNCTTQYIGNTAYTDCN